MADKPNVGFGGNHPSPSLPGRPRLGEPVGKLLPRSPHRSHPGDAGASDEARIEAGVKGLIPALTRALERDPLVREAVRDIVLRDISIAIDTSELTLRESLERQMGAVLGAVHKTARVATSSVRSPRAFRAMVAAVVVLFVTVAFGSVAFVRDIAARSSLRGEMAGMVEEARGVARENTAIREDVGALQGGIRDLESRQSQDDELRSQVTGDLSSFRVELDNLGAALASLQNDVSDTERELREELSKTRRDQSSLAGRIAPVEAVTLHNPARYQRSELDRMAGEQCRDEADAHVRRAYPSWHVRSCRDGWNDAQYRMWCAEFHRGQSPDMQFSGCTSTAPSWNS